jgi:hypothetical protein
VAITQRAVRPVMAKSELRKEKQNNEQQYFIISKCGWLRVKKEIRQGTSPYMLIFCGNICKYYLVRSYSF